MPEKIMLDSLLGTDSISWIQRQKLGDQVEEHAAKSKIRERDNQKSARELECD
jgi:hypothetical protein